MKKVLILGGGFAGLESAIWLRKYGYDVTLISNRDYMYIFPISIWIPVKGIEFKDATLSFKELEKIHGFKFIQDEVLEIQSKQNKVICKNNTYADYDYLVMAIGSGKLK
jgi:sulfide:quinone oxidoreductase